MKINKERIKHNLKTFVEESPEKVLLLAVGTLPVLTKLMQANTERQNSKTWRKEVQRREIATYDKYGKKK